MVSQLEIFVLFTYALIYNYQALNQVGINESNFTAKISIDFNLSGYSVSCTNLTVEKLYGTQLTDAEITQLVDSESRRHKDAIEAKIEELKK